MPIRREPHITREMVETEALRLWREREMSFPERVRRMTPDGLDFATGAWMAMWMTAIGNLRQAPPPSVKGG